MWRASFPRRGLPGCGTTVAPYGEPQGATALNSKGKTMLKGIDRAISAELLMVLMSMGHGDDLLICDVNHPAATIARETTYGRLVSMAGCDLPRAAEAILSLLPLDTFVPAPVIRMKVVDDPERIMPVHERLQSVIDRVEGRAVAIEALERFDFYATAKRAFAVVRTSVPGLTAALSCARASSETHEALPGFRGGGHLNVM